MTTTHSETDFDFSAGYGAEVAKDSAKSGGLRFDKPDWFSLDGSQAGVARGADRDVLRFLTDHQPVPSNPIPWITVNMHTMVKTRPAPADLPEGRKWPATMSAVCREDKIFQGKLAPCYIDLNIKKQDGKPNRSAARTWALAVRREEVKGTQEMVDSGQIPAHLLNAPIGYRDRTKEVAVTGADGKVVEGETKIVPDIVIVQQAWKNFWSPLQGFASVHHTVLDRDYVIIRSGAQTDTTYQIIALDPIRRPDGTIYDLRDPVLFQEKYPNLPDLRKIVLSQADDEYFARFFDVTKPQPAAKSADGTAAAAPAAAQAQAAPAAPAKAADQEMSQDALAALRARVIQGTPAATPAAEQTPPVAEAAPPAAAAPEAPQDSAPAAEPAQAAAPQPVATGPVALD